MSKLWTKLTLIPPSDTSWHFRRLYDYKMVSQSFVFGSIDGSKHPKTSQVDIWRHWFSGISNSICFTHVLTMLDLGNFTWNLWQKYDFVVMSSSDPPIHGSTWQACRITTRDTMRAWKCGSHLSHNVFTSGRLKKVDQIWPSHQESISMARFCNIRGVTSIIFHLSTRMTFSLRFIPVDSL